MPDFKDHIQFNRTEPERLSQAVLRSLQQSCSADMILADDLTAKAMAYKITRLTGRGFEAIILHTAAIRRKMQILYFSTLYGIAVQSFLLTKEVMRWVICKQQQLNSIAV